MPETPELNSALLHAIMTWITPLLHLEWNISPTITSAYRIGAASSIRPNFPCDIILQFLYAKERDVVLHLARRGGALSYLGSNIIVLDLPQGILLKRKSLKPITDQLKSKNVHFRWNNVSDIVVVKDGTQYKAEDLASGHTLLATLDISLSPS